MSEFTLWETIPRVIVNSRWPNLEVALINRPTRGKAGKRAVPSHANSSGLKLITIPDSWRRKAERTSNVIESFFHAFRGFAEAFRAERNLRIHVAMAVAVIAAGLALKVEPMGWATLSLAVGMVMCSELVNTALERLVDITTDGEFHRLARDAKDISAAAVMCAAVVATLIGLLVFVPKIISVLQV